MRRQMQRDWLALNGKSSEGETATRFAGDFGLHYPMDYIRRTFIYLNRGWGWPELGGWANQDQRLLDDLDVWAAQYEMVGKAADEGWLIPEHDQALPEPVRAHSKRFEEL